MKAFKGLIEKKDLIGSLVSSGDGGSIQGFCKE